MGRLLTPLGKNMRIGGLQKTSLIDYPEHISALVFTQGCNFHCPYCHNPFLVPGNGELIEEETVLDFLKKRKYILQGLVITGGEPTLQKDLIEFCSKVKNIGYKIKLDTNGSNPKVLKELLKLNLIDYIAMDIKGKPSSYAEDICPSQDYNIVQSIQNLQEAYIPYEFRIPCAMPYINFENFSAIVQALPKQSILYLQKINFDTILNPNFSKHKNNQFSAQDLENLKKIALNNNISCFLR